MEGIETTTKYILFSVRFPTNDREVGDPIYFTKKSDAEKCGNLKRGWFNSTGFVSKTEWDAHKLPRYYTSFLTWGEDNLTVNQIRELI